MRAFALALTILTASAGLAEGPSTSIRPQPRPGTEAAPAEAAPAVLAPASQPAAPKIPVPKPRPPGLIAAAAAQSPATQIIGAIPSTAPKPRPSDLASAVSAQPTAPAKSTKKGKKGSVCGDPDIKGEALAAIPAKFKGCGLDEPVRVSNVAGISLSPADTISCDTAAALKDWIETGMNPAFGNREVVELKIAASYICRTRNTQKGAKISEHGRGKAIDISGFLMSNGKLWTVASDYNSTIRKAQKAACGIFGTTLGPGSDGFHEDHLHFDIASHGNGSYCR